MAKYSTRQRDLLLSYLEAHADEQMSIQKIASDLEEQKVSSSAVYRNLFELEKENRVKRCIRDNSREVLYQYIDLPECRSSLHLMCRVCGRMFHLEPEQTNKLVEHVEKAQGFVIDKSETILYGVCKDCR